MLPTSGDTRQRSGGQSILIACDYPLEGEAMERMLGFFGYNAVARVLSESVATLGERKDDILPGHHRSIRRLAGCHPLWCAPCAWSRPRCGSCTPGRPAAPARGLARPCLDQRAAQSRHRGAPGGGGAPVRGRARRAALTPRATRAQGPAAVARRPRRPTRLKRRMSALMRSGSKRSFEHVQALDDRAVVEPVEALRDDRHRRVAQQLLIDASTDDLGKISRSMRSQIGRMLWLTTSSEAPRWAGSARAPSGAVRRRSHRASPIRSHARSA